jgi:hypothetical protein
MSLILDGTNGLSDVDGSAATPAIRGSDANTGVFFGADQVGIATNGVERVEFGNSETVFNDGGADVDFRVESDTDANALFVQGSDGNVGIGTSSPSVPLTVQANTSAQGIRIRGRAAGDGGNLAFFSNDNATEQLSIFSSSGENAFFGTGSRFMSFSTDNTERVRIGSSGGLLVGKTAFDSDIVGAEIRQSGIGVFAVSGDITIACNRLANDGVLISLRQAGTEEGSISVSGTTVSYNGGHLSRWAQTTTAKDESLVKGTVLSNLDEMNVYVAPTTYWTEEDELPEGVNVGDVKVETHEVQNEQLNKVKVSDVEGDANVAGVFVNWEHDDAHDVDEINMAMTGDMIIRIAQGTTVQRGDLLMSAGDGTAKPQGDDIVRSKTIAKVTSTHVTCTYADGSFCVPCVLMAC